MILQEVKKMGATSMQSFEGKSGQFKSYSPLNRKPVELIEKFGWRQWRWMRLPIQSNPSRCILNTLEASCVLKWSALQDGVQLIKTRRNECWCVRGSHAVISWPAQSPGVNIIENIWKVLKSHVQKEISSIETRDDLIECVLNCCVDCIQPKLYQWIPRWIHSVRVSKGYITKCWLIRGKSLLILIIIMIFIKKLLHQVRLPCSRHYYDSLVAINCRVNNVTNATDMKVSDELTYTVCVTNAADMKVSDELTYTVCVTSAADMKVSDELTYTVCVFQRISQYKCQSTTNWHHCYISC